MSRRVPKWIILLMVTALSGVPTIAQVSLDSTNSKAGADLFALGRGTSLYASSGKGPAPYIQGLSGPAREVLSEAEEALKLIRTHYADGNRLSDEVLVESAIQGMLSSLDPHSNFFNHRDFEELLDAQHSQYSGIGATVANHKENGKTGTYIISCEPGSPAAVAGLGFGDRILSVDGRNVEEMTAADVSRLVRGPDGTSVKLLVESASGTWTSATLRRARIPQPSIPDHYVIRDGIGYVAMTDGFTDTTASELKDAIADLKRQGMRALIIDLRGNPGGLLLQAVKVAETFLPKGDVILSQRGRHSYDNAVWRSTNPKPDEVPLAVLVNDSTASAAEIVAGALQDQDRALIIGEPTFGKGLVQSVLDLPGRRGLTLTSARYYTPSGRSLQRDYTGVGRYDYLARKKRQSRGDGIAITSVTAGGRIVDSGNGVTPDIFVADTMTAVTQSRRSDIFLFTRHVMSKATRSELPVGVPMRWHEARLPAGMMEEFLENWRTGTTYAESMEALEVEVGIRYSLATAEAGPRQGARVLIESDQLVGRAIDELRGPNRYALLPFRSSGNMPK